jgi:hypothetical protein
MCRRILEYIVPATSAVAIVHSNLACPGSLPLTRMIVEGKGHEGERIAAHVGWALPGVLAGPRDPPLYWSKSQPPPRQAVLSIPVII